MSPFTSGTDAPTERSAVGVRVRPTGVARLRPPLPAASVVLPTRNEAANIAALLDRLARATPGADLEVIFVDDSDDDTPGVIARQAAGRPFPVRVVHRPRGERAGGLGSAVVAGLRAARHDWVVVMDADLQHPPEVVPVVLARAGRGEVPGTEAGGASADEAVDVVVASRYAPGGQDGAGADGLDGWHRRLVSQACTRAAKLAFPRRLRRVSDPMSGMFAVRRSRLPLDALAPEGFKILLEIVVRAGLERVDEVPFVFAERHAGDSKAGLREGLRYGRHLLTLRAAAWAAAARPTTATSDEVTR